MNTASEPSSNFGTGTGQEKTDGRDAAETHQEDSLLEKTEQPFCE